MGVGGGQKTEGSFYPLYNLISPMQTRNEEYKKNGSGIETRILGNDLERKKAIKKSLKPKTYYVDCGCNP